MLTTLVLALCVQAPKASALGQTKPWWETLKPGDILRLDTGIPNTGTPLIRLWHIPDDGRPAELSELDCWALCAALKGGEPLEQVHFMGDRGALRYAPNGTQARVVAIHPDWAIDPLKGVPMAEIVVALPTGEFRPEDPVPASRPFTYAVPVAYLGDPAHRHPQLGRLPILVRTSERHPAPHPYCLSDAPGPHGEHLDAVLFADAERAWRERERRSEEIRRRGEAEAKKRARQGR